MPKDCELRLAGRGGFGSHCYDGQIAVSSSASNSRLLSAVHGGASGKHKQEVRVWWRCRTDSPSRSKLELPFRVRWLQLEYRRKRKLASGYHNIFVETD